MNRFAENRVICSPDFYEEMEEKRDLNEKLGNSQSKDTHSEDQFECDCGLRFRTLEDLHNHLEAVASRRTWKLAHGKHFSLNKLYYNFYDFYDCKHCSMRFLSEYELLEHVRKTYYPNLQAYSEVDSVSPTPSRNETLQETNGPGTSFDNDSRPKEIVEGTSQSKKQINNVDIEQQTNRLRITYYQCKTCSKLFRKKCKMLKHANNNCQSHCSNKLTTDTQLKDDVATNKFEMPSTSSADFSKLKKTPSRILYRKFYKCDECKQLFKRKSRCDIHMKNQDCLEYYKNKVMTNNKDAETSQASYIESVTAISAKCKKVRFLKKGFCQKFFKCTGCDRLLHTKFNCSYHIELQKCLHKSKKRFDQPQNTNQLNVDVPPNEVEKIQ